MSTFVMSDLHGEYGAYQKMLEKIRFSEEDRLYILGDILDRGAHPIPILLDLMERDNVTILAGNHCAMALQCLPFLMQEVTDESVAHIDITMIRKLSNWQYNGSKTTIDEFRSCDTKTQRKIIDFISNFELYEELEVSGRSYVLVHAGLGHFRPEKPLCEYDLHELVWERPDYTVPYYSNRYVISGHTPTMTIGENPKPGYIYQANNHIAIDCGCCWPEGRLACLRLEDLAEFYVEKTETE